MMSVGSNPQFGNTDQVDIHHSQEEAGQSVAIRVGIRGQSKWRLSPSK